MKGVFFAAAFLCSLISTAQSVLVRPVIVQYKLKQGETQTKSVAVVNNLDKTMQFKLYIGSWERDTTGAHIYADSPVNKHSCAKWITLDKEFIELAPNSSTDVNIKMTVPNTPEAAEAMKWAMLFVEDVKETKTVTVTKGFSTTVNNAFRIGVHLYQTPPFAIRKDVRIVSFKSLADNPGTYRMVCVNEGNTMVECRGNMEINSLSDGSKVELKQQTFPMFPDQKRFVEFALPPTLAKGKYSILGSIDSGDDAELQAVQATVDIN